MLSVMARTRPRRSPSQPNPSPPAAAPSRNKAVMRPIQTPTNWSPTRAEAGIMLWRAGRATSGKMPISTPSNIQPRKPAARTNHCARLIMR